MSRRKNLAVLIGLLLVVCLGIAAWAGDDFIIGKARVKPKGIS